MFVLEKQVVVLKVSLHCHCRGCEGKVKKHLSRMQGQSILGPVRFVNWTRHPDADANQCSFGVKYEVKLDAASGYSFTTHPDFPGILDDIFKRFQKQ